MDQEAVHIRRSRPDAEEHTRGSRPQAEAELGISQSLPSLKRHRAETSQSLPHSAKASWLGPTRTEPSRNTRVNGLACFLCAIKRDIAETIISFLDADKCHVRGILDWYELQEDRALSTYHLNIICKSLNSYCLGIETSAGKMNRIGLILSHGREPQISRLTAYVRRDYVYDAEGIMWQEDIGALIKQIPIWGELAAVVAAKLVLQRGIWTDDYMGICLGNRGRQISVYGNVIRVGNYRDPQEIFILEMERQITLANVCQRMKVLEPVFRYLDRPVIVGSFVLHMLLREPPNWEPEDINVCVPPVSKNYDDNGLASLAKAMGATVVDDPDSNVSILSVPSAENQPSMRLKIIWVDVYNSRDLDISSFWIAPSIVSNPNIPDLGSFLIEERGGVKRYIAWSLGLTIQGLVSLSQGRFSCMKDKTTTQKRIEKYIARGYLPNRINIEPTG
jgi:hypothetical protein